MTYAQLHVQCRTNDGRGPGSYVGQNYEPISPVFDSLQFAYRWMVSNGWEMAEWEGEVFHPWRVIKK